MVLYQKQNNSKMKNMDILSIGDITTDAFIQINKNASVTEDAQNRKKLCVNFGDKIEYEDVTVVKGVGNSPNVAVLASRLGLDSALFTYLGDDSNGKEILKHLSYENVNTDYVIVEQNKKTNYHYVLRHGAERTILIKHYSYNYKFIEPDIAPKWIYLSSMSENSLKLHEEISDYLARNPEIKLAFQPGTFQILWGIEKIRNIYERTHIFFCNKEEAQQILQTNETDIVKLLSMIRNSGVKTAVITDGPNGAYAQDDSHIYKVPMYPDPAPPIDRTGAGDAFSGTVTAMLAKGMILKEALLRGPVNSMSVVQHIGAQKGLLSTKELEKYLSEAPKEYIIKII